MLTGLGLVVLSSAFVLVDRASVTGFMPVREYKPAWLLMAEAYTLGDRRASIATDEIARRINLGELNKKHNDRLVSISLARHAQTWRAFPDAQWMVITEAIAARELTTAQIRLVLDNLIEDGFVLGLRKQRLSDNTQPAGYDDLATPLEPGRSRVIEIGVNYRAGRLVFASTSSWIWYGTMSPRFKLHERPDLIQNSWHREVQRARASRSTVVAGLPRVDSSDYVVLNIPWIDGTYTGTATFVVEFWDMLRFASDTVPGSNAEQTEYVHFDIPIELEVASTEKHRFPVLEVSSLPSDPTAYVELKVEQHDYGHGSRPSFPEYSIELKQDTDIDWSTTAIAGHVVLRQGDRVYRKAVDQSICEREEIELYLQLINFQQTNPFEPGEVQVSYEHNEALAAFRYARLGSNYKQILGGPIELGTIVIPGPAEPEKPE